MKERREVKRKHMGAVEKGSESAKRMLGRDCPCTPLIFHFPFFFSRFFPLPPPPPPFSVSTEGASAEEREEEVPKDGMLGHHM